MNLKIVAFCSVIVLSSLQSCKKASVDAEENELITTVKLNFTANGTTQSFSWKDTDGDGGKNPVIDNIVLKANTIYTITTEFLDESKSPTSNLTDEIKTNGYEHLIIYTTSPNGFANYSYGDKDINNLPIGLTGTYKTLSVGKGVLKVQLRHQPAINGKATKDGSISPGSDDANVDFNLVVE